MTIFWAQYSSAQYTVDSIYTHARAGNIEKVKAKLAGGYDQDILNNTLGAAVVGNQADLVRFLADKGADVNQLSSYNTPLLNSAIMYGFFDSALALIEAGADPETRGFRRIEFRLTIEYNWTPLLCAARQGHIDVIERLLEFGADPTEKGWSNSVDDIETPADVAAYSGHLDALKLLSKRGSMISESTVFKTVRGGHMDTFKYLVKNERDIDRIGPQRKTLLMEASWWGRTDMVKYLLRKGADPTIVGDNNQTALIEVLSNPEITQKIQYEIVKRLIKKGSDINFKTDNDLTALNLAQKYRRKDIVRMLYDAGAKD